ncbi:hypothetical protein K1719_003175 [Acacia pycnantha]|nr:hypothetical protein K1719_003175 [Acacia pycnantha]
MSSDIEVVEEVQSRNQQPAASGTASAGGELGEESLRDDVYTTAAFGDLEKLHRLVEQEGCSVSEPDGLGYYALQWAALNNRTAAAQYIIERNKWEFFIFLVLEVLAMLIDHWWSYSYKNIN